MHSILARECQWFFFTQRGGDSAFLGNAFLMSAFQPGIALYCFTWVPISHDKYFTSGIG